MGQSRISFQVIMNSMKVTICLLVIGQLQPAIARIVASTLGGVGQGAVQATSFGQGAGGFSQGNSFRGGSSVGSNGFSQSSSFGGSSSGSSSLSASRLTSNVVTALQPQIAAAVAQALRSSQAGPVRGGAAGGAALSEEEEAEYNRKLSANAQYEFGYKVADDDKQTYMAHEETRNGEAVQGKYSYVDPSGALVTVNYEAGPMGYTETRDVQENAVQIDARNIAQPWTGPLAGVTSSSSPSSASSGAVSATSSSLSQSQLIEQILRAIQPQINSAVQTAIGSRSSAAAGSFNRGTSSRVSSANLQSGSRRGFNSQSNLISTIIGSIQPQISGAVQTALARARPSQGQVRTRPVVAPASGVTDVFGGSGVRIQTPDFNIEY